jgi:hypothetical protein
LHERITQLQEMLSFLQWKIDHYDDLMREKEAKFRAQHGAKLRPRKTART